MAKFVFSLPLQSRDKHILFHFFNQNILLQHIFWLLESYEVWLNVNHLIITKTVYGKKMNHFFFKRIIVTFKRLPFNSIAWIIEMFHMKLCAEHLQLKVDFLHNNRAEAKKLESESDSDPVAACLLHHSKI